MEQEILTASQKQALAFIAQEPKLSSFYLSGGTALTAYYLGHRYSDDLDFFTEQAIDIQFLHQFVELLKQGVNGTVVRFERLHDRNLFFLNLGQDKEELKVEFTKYPFTSLEMHESHNGVRVDSLRDIAANKLMAILDRFEPKDFVDLYFLLHEFELPSLQADTEQKFHLKIAPILLGSELAKVRRITGLPKMIKPLTVEELKTFFTKIAANLSPQILE